MECTLTDCPKIGDHFLLPLHMSNSVSDELGLVFVARGLTRSVMEPEDTEELKVQELALPEAIAMAQDGRITDALSVTGLLHLALTLR